MTFVEFILLLILVAPFLVILGYMNHPSNHLGAEAIRMEEERRRAMKGDYSKKPDED